MASYKLVNGYTVDTAKVDEKTEFVTSDPEGTIVSTVYLGASDAAETERELIIANRLASL